MTSPIVLSKALFYSLTDDRGQEGVNPPHLSPKTLCVFG